VQRIVLEMLGVTLSADGESTRVATAGVDEGSVSRAPRPAVELRMQQVLAFESDLLEYPDIFAGSSVMGPRSAELTKGAQNELDDVVASAAPSPRSTN